MPLLHPAHPLDPGRVSGSVGASGHFLLGDVEQAIEEADAQGPAFSGEAGDTTAKGVAADVVGAPGVAPFVAGRVGIAEHAEAGLTYAGSRARIDGRYAFESGALALSGGLGLGILLAHPTADPNDPPSGVGGIDTGAVSGFGVDVPVVVGYRSDGEIVQVWGGIRASYEQAGGEVLVAGAPENTRAELDATGISAQGLIGLAVGLRPVWVAAELGVGYLNVKGELSDPAGGPSSSARVDGVTLTPAGALMGRF